MSSGQNESPSIAWTFNFGAVSDLPVRMVQLVVGKEMAVVESVELVEIVKPLIPGIPVAKDHMFSEYIAVMVAITIFCRKQNPLPGGQGVYCASGPAALVVKVESVEPVELVEPVKIVESAVIESVEIMEKPSVVETIEIPVMKFPVKSVKIFADEHSRVEEPAVIIKLELPFHFKLAVIELPFKLELSFEIVIVVKLEFSLELEPIIISSPAGLGHRCGRKGGNSQYCGSDQRAKKQFFLICEHKHCG